MFTSDQLEEIEKLEKEQVFEIKKKLKSKIRITNFIYLKDFCNIREKYTQSLLAVYEPSS
jgi:hypothetical protein